ncbi:hypothetical protein [Paenibacillus herberti]|uniref:hypothetical protein n=1 Tax=Paenibacillus herberti TaxID=1619309 RepID=UPI001595CA4D|nr:hypothetical protein [Paenibacillus herberti]
MPEKQVPRWAFLLVGAIIILIITSSIYAIYALSQPKEGESKQTGAIEQRITGSEY